MTSSGAARLPITKTGGNKGGWIGQKVWMSCVIWLPASSLCTFAPHPKVRWKRFQRPSHSEKWTDEVFWISLPSCGQLWKFCIVFSLGRAVHTGLTGWQKISGRLQTNEISNSQSWLFGIFHEPNKYALLVGGKWRTCTQKAQCQDSNRELPQLKI